MTWNENAERVRARLHRRVDSYRALFVLRPTQAETFKWWQRGFWAKPEGGELGVAADVVLRDLARYCYANKPTLKVSQITQQSDPYAMAFAEGRRDVFNRITAMCNLTPDQIAQIASRGND